MKSHQVTHSRAKLGGGGSRAVLELKQRVVASLNKLADRDTYQIGVEELEKAAEGLTLEGIGPFLSCITDTDSEHKSAVRKECVRIMGTLARFHGSMLAPPHLAKMVATIVKRLKDSDSVVRDACVETAGVLATSSSTTTDAGAAFVALVRPFFEALGEQNRYVQTGSALCLAKVIDDSSGSDPPTSALQQMLTRVIKLLKNPHFMAKPAVIELIRSIVQAGGATTEHSLSAAVTSLLAALKSTDWTTRRAASLALAGIAVSAGSLLGSSRTSCIHSLESCRFDKVKPVRDAITHALQCWKTLPGTDSPEPSDVGSSTKENMNVDYLDVTSASDGGWRDMSCRNVGPVSAHGGNITSSTTKRIPLTVRKTCQNYARNRQHSNPHDWHIEISFPKTQNMPSVEGHRKDSGDSFNVKAFERTVDATRGQDIEYDYDPTDDKPECSSMSDLISGSFETKHVTVAHDCLDECDSANLIRINNRSAIEEADTEGLREKERNSLDSTVTDLSSQGTHGCCLRAANELAFIRGKLVEIETRQSNLLDLLQVFMGNSMDNMSTLQLKVHNLEHAVENIAQNISHKENDSHVENSRLLKKNQSVSSSPRLSTCTPRPSVHASYRHPSSLSLKNSELSENSLSRSRSSTSAKERVERWRDPTLNIIKNPRAVDMQKTGRIEDSRSTQQKGRRDQISISTCANSANQFNLEGKFACRKRIKEFLCAGDIESAYAEALCTGDDLGIVELMDRTGPILEKLSHETADVLLSSLTNYFLNQRFTGSIIPWFQQVVTLSSACESKHLVLSTKTQMEFLFALQEAAAMECIDPMDRLLIAQFQAKLSQLWGEPPQRKILPAMGSRGSKNFVPNGRG